MSETVTASDNTMLPISSLAQVITYDGALVSTVSVSYNQLIYVQTFTNNGTQITGVSKFIPHSAT